MTTTRAPETAPEGASDAALAHLAKALGHPARIRIIRLLMRQKSCIGGDIVAEVGLAQSTVSEHLRILRDAGIIIGEIERPRICYSLNPDHLRPLVGFISALANNAPQDDTCAPFTAQ